MKKKGRGKKLPNIEALEDANRFVTGGIPVSVARYL
jgi:hypothetical protein